APPEDATELLLRAHASPWHACGRLRIRHEADHPPGRPVLDGQDLARDRPRLAPPPLLRLSIQARPTDGGECTRDPHLRELVDQVGEHPLPSPCRQRRERPCPRRLRSREQQSICLRELRKYSDVTLRRRIIRAGMYRIVDLARREQQLLVLLLRGDVRLLDLVEPAGLVESREQDTEVRRALTHDGGAPGHRLHGGLTLAGFAPLEDEAVKAIESARDAAPLNCPPKVSGGRSQLAATDTCLELSDLHPKLGQRARPILGPSG